MEVIAEIVVAEETQRVDLEDIQTDIHNMEEDVKKINCSAIYDLITHTLKCIKDCILYFCHAKKD